MNNILYYIAYSKYIYNISYKTQLKDKQLQEIRKILTTAIRSTI